MYTTSSTGTNITRYTGIAILSVTMGWFDESESEEDEKPKNRIDKNSEYQSGSNHVAHEEDTLDAYMKSLETIATSNKALSDASCEKDDANQGDEPGDWEKAEEISTVASSHRALHHQKCLRSESEAEDDDSDGFLSSRKSMQQQAKHALESTFVKAVGCHNSEYRVQDNQMKQATTKITDDSTLKTTTVLQPPNDVRAFEKRFWFGSYNSVEAKMWRDTNSIKCCPLKINRVQAASDGIIDPVYEFFELRDVLGHNLLQKLLKDYSKPTLVQCQTLPLALSGNDAIITAATGK
jgi:hypothetical protein